MLSTSIGSCIRRRRRKIPRPPGVRFRRTAPILFLGSILLSAVEQEKGDKAGQDPKHRAENSEPEREVPVGAGSEFRLAAEFFC